MMKFTAIIFLFLSFLPELRSQSFDFYRTSPELIYTNDTFGIVSNAKINNLTNSPLTLRVIKSYANFPQGWEACICDIVVCHPPGVDTAIADYPPGLSSVDVMIYVHSIPGTGYLTVRTEKVSNPNEHINLNFGCSYSPLGIQQISTLVKDFNLEQNYPNPFNPNTKIYFSIPKSGQIFLNVYDMLGREVKTLINEKLSAGEYEIDFNGTNIPSGVYYYSLKSEDYIKVKKMVLIK